MLTTYVRSWVLPDGIDSDLMFERADGIYRLWSQSPVMRLRLMVCFVARIFSHQFYYVLFGEPYLHIDFCGEVGLM